MLSVASDFPPGSFPARSPLLEQRRRGLAYARAAGVAAGLFMLLWAPLSLGRWEGEAPWFARVEAVFYCVYAVLLLIPYGRVRNARLWRVLAGALGVASVLFAFVLVVDVMFTYMAVAGMHEKPPPPLLNSALAFLAILQAPTVLFLRHPDWLD